LTHLALAAVLALLPGAAPAQLGLPPVGGAVGGPLRDPIDRVGDIVDPMLERVDLDRLSPRALARQLEQARLARLADFVRSHRDRVEADRDGNPALRGVLLVTGADADALARAEARGYRVITRETIEGLDLTLVRLAIPDGRSLAGAQKEAAKLLPDAEISADTLYFQAAAGAPSPIGVPATPGLLAAPSGSGRYGLIDGGVATAGAAGPIAAQRGFVDGAPAPSDHGSAVAALMARAARTGGAATPPALYAADVYGSDPVGGNASTIVRALGWLAASGVGVVNISLVGPDNPLLRAGVRQAQGRGIIIVAATGNDGPAAPPAYPAAWPGVLAVTGVDQKDHVLPEAGQGRHVAFAARGAGLSGPDHAGRIQALRGTSFAAPIVAGMLAARYSSPDRQAIELAVRTLIAGARDLGRKGRDPVYGHGLVCPDCR